MKEALCILITFAFLSGCTISKAKPSKIRAVKPIPKAAVSKRIYKPKPLPLPVVKKVKEEILPVKEKEEILPFDEDIK